MTATTQPGLARTTYDEAGRPVSYEVAGEIVTLPVEVRSARMIGAQYFVDADVAQGIIDDSGLTIARQRGNRAVCSVNAVQYLDNDLGPYNEIAVAFVVHAHDAPDAKVDMRKPTTLIHRLPVNQTFTCAAGKGIWGFPKWVTSIDLSTTPSRWGKVTEAVLIDDDEFVLALSVRRSPVPLPAQEMEMSCYSWCDGILRRTPWTTRTSRTTARIGGAQIELGSRHPMAQELRRLGLPKKAFMSMTTGLMTATFGAAEDLGEPADA
jgi:hypothetical protein